jgi:thiol peroxidase
MPTGGLSAWDHLRGHVDLMLFSVNLKKIVLKALIFEPNQKEREAEMNERAGLITMRGNPLTLIGQEIKPGNPAPDFASLDNELKPVRLSSFRGKVVVISAVPSLDTPVCDMETRRFNSEAAKLSDDIVILTISMDLPFAQKRWCGAAGVDKVVTLSDHREAEFGKAYGVLIKELRLLARAVFVIDAEGVVRYVQLVNEVAEEPDYDAVISAAKNLV